MPLREKIETDYKNALKSKDKIQISTYRLILSGIKDLDIVNRSGSNKKETNDEDIKKLLKKMSLREKIDNDYKNALKSKDKNKISTYRLILAGIKDLDINNRSGPDKKETVDEDIKKLLKKMIKQRSESIDIYKKNNRNDLLEVEQSEVNILSSYLPKQLGEDETKKLCSEVIQKLGASSIKDMGKVMGELKKNHSDSLDFSKAGSILKQMLNK